MLPIVTVLGMDLALAFGATIFIEMAGSAHPTKLRLRASCGTPSNPSRRSTSKGDVRTVCEQARELLSRQLDDDLSTHETASLERHLLRCPACAAFATNSRAHTEVLRSAALEPAPQFWLPRRHVATRLTTRVAAVTAAAAAAALVAVSSLSLQGGPSRSSGAFDFWPRGLAVHPRGDENLGVQRAAFLPRGADGPRGRGFLHSV